MLNNQKELILLKDLGRKKLTSKSRYKTRQGLYKCFCGNEFKAISTAINTGKKISCGCINKKNTTHGLTNHRLYRIWNGIMNRCFNEGSSDYPNYGGRGITVCEEWIYIEDFISDMYPSFIEGLSIDRIDNNGNYEPSNCRWASKEIQNRNTRVLRANNTSGYRGVSWFSPTDKFVARIKVDTKVTHLGTFNTAIEAAYAYDKYIIENRLEHSKNFN